MAGGDVGTVELSKAPPERSRNGRLDSTPRLAGLGVLLWWGGVFPFKARTLPAIAAVA
jgi:hypothetical protein